MYSCKICISQGVDLDPFESVKEYNAHLADQHRPAVLARKPPQSARRKTQSRRTQPRSRRPPGNES